MNALRKERDDENLSTADLVNRTNARDVRDQENVTPRQAYTERQPARSGTANPPDYIPPQGAIPPQPARGPQPVPSQVQPAAPVAAVPGSGSSPASNVESRPAPGPVPVGQSLSHAVQESSPNAAENQENQRNALFPDDELHNYRARWDQVQASFVDEPRKAVERADSLVANVVKRLAEQFATERESLEKQWDRGDDVNTEDLRQALRRYRAFFDRLLSV